MAKIFYIAQKFDEIRSNNPGVFDVRMCTQALIITRVYVYYWRLTKCSAIQTIKEVSEVNLTKFARGGIARHCGDQ